MKTSSVHSTTSSIFRNQQQYVHSNERFYRMMGDGGQSQSQQQRQQQPKSQAPKKAVLKNSNRYFVKGFYYTANYVPIRNQLIQTSKFVQYTNKKKSYRYTYRNSI